MNRTPPPPICKAFLVCGQIVDDPKIQDTVLAGLPTGFTNHTYPAARALGFFARWTSAHGNYLVEVLLQTPEGKTVWRDGPPEAWPMNDPVHLYDMKLNLTVVFPEPGTYDFILTANGEEIARQQFHAQLVPRMAAK